MELFHGISDMALSSTIEAGIGFFILALFLYFLMIYNNLVRLKVDIDKAWANVDVLLKQRHDEVPNLVAAVAGVRDFEKNVMTQITQARSAAQGAQTLSEKSQTEGALSSSLNRLFAVAENYPDLKAQDNFLKLQKRLSEIENEISDRRSFYNDSVAAYNTRTVQFPDGVLASSFGFKPRELFHLEDAQKEPVAVGFSS